MSTSEESVPRRHVFVDKDAGSRQAGSHDATLAMAAAVLQPLLLTRRKREKKEIGVDKVQT